MISSWVAKGSYLSGYILYFAFALVNPRITELDHVKVVVIQCFYLTVEENEA